MNITEKELAGKIFNYSKENTIWNREEEKITVNNICTLLLNSYYYSINANALIWSKKIEDANKAGESIVEILESILGENVAAMDEDRFLQLKINEISQKYILVRNFKGKNIQLFYDMLCSFEKNNWKHNVIICADENANNELKQFSKNDFRLYQYLLSSRLFLHENEAEDIYGVICEKLGTDPYNYVLTDSFNLKLSIYIRAIYSEAQFKDREFVEDCINRIMREHYKVLNPSQELTAEDVPFSRKAEILLHESNNKAENVAAEKIDDKNIHEDNERIEDCDIESVDIENISEINTNEVSTNYENKETYNIVITNVSTLSIREGKTQERQYFDDVDDKLFGKMTNEAPIKSIIRRLQKAGDKVDEIIFIASDTVQCKNKKKLKIDDYDRELTHLEFLQEQLNKYIKNEKYQMPEYKCIDINDEPNEKEVSKTVFEVYQNILSCVNQYKNRKINIYIEANGGVRYVLTMLLSLTKTLENYYKNVHIVEVTSMVLANITQIKNTKRVYDTAQITGIADEFVNYGRTSSLQRYIEIEIQNMAEDQKQLYYFDVHSMLEKLNKTANDIQLCRTSMILDDFYGANNLKIMINSFIEKYKDDENAPAFVSVFVHLLELIYEELQKTIYSVEIGQEEIEPIVYLPQMINWCLEKSFIQQALTFCAERLAEYLFATGKLQFGDQFNEYFLNYDTGHYERTYHFLANLKEHTDRLRDADINKIIEEIRDTGQFGNTADNTFFSGISSSEWDDIFIDSSFSSSITWVGTEKLDNICNFIKQYDGINNSEISDNDIIDLFEGNGFLRTELNYLVKISNKNSTALKNALKGQYKDKNGNIISHPNLNTKKDRIKKCLPALIQIFINREKNSKYDVAKRCYDQIIDEIYEGLDNLVDSLKDKYSKPQSRKFYILDTIETGQVITNISSKDDLQKLIYIYSLCKEQRNFSNHAHVEENDLNVVLDSENLKKLIKELLKYTK